MPGSLSLQLFRPRWLTEHTAAGLVESLLAAGFRLEAEPGGVRHALGADYMAFEYRHLAEPLAVFGRDGGVSLTLWKAPLGGDRRDVVLTLLRGAESPELPPPDRGLDRVSLGTWDPRINTEPYLYEEFLGCANLLVALTCPWYGDGDANESLAALRRSPEPSIAALEPPLLSWLTVFGPPHVRRLGLAALLTAPAWRVEIIPDGSVAVVLTPRPQDVTEEIARQVAAHLGLPDPAADLDAYPPPTWAPTE